MLKKILLLLAVCLLLLTMPVLAQRMTNLIIAIHRLLMAKVMNARAVSVPGGNNAI